MRVFLPIMKTATNMSQKYWFSLVLDILTEKLIPDKDTTPDSGFLDGYSACKTHYLDSTPDLREFRGQVVATLGNLATFLTAEQLEEELPWVAEQIRSLQCSMSSDMAFDLIKPLRLYIKAATMKASRGLEAAVPAVLPALLHPIRTPSSRCSDKGQEVQKVSKSLILSIAQSHPSAVFRYFKKILIRPDAHSRVWTVRMLRELLAGTDCESTFYLEAVLHTLQDDNHKVILEVLGLISALTDKGCYDKNGKEVIEYLVKRSSLPVQNKQTSHHALVEEEAVRTQSTALLSTLGLRRGNTDEVFWTGVLKFMLQKDFIGSVPTLCQILLLVDKETRIDLKECAKHISIQSLLIRLLVISSVPRWEVERGTAVLAMLERLIPVIYPPLAGLFSQRIPPLIEHLQASSRETFSLEQWMGQLVSFMDAVVEDPPYYEWKDDLMGEMSTQFLDCSYHEHEVDFLFKCFGRCLASCENSKLVLFHLRNIFSSTRFIPTPDYQTSHRALEANAHKETILHQSAALLRTIARRRGRTDKVFWSGILTFMLENDFIGSVPTLCRILLLADKHNRINLKDYVKHIPRHCLLIRLLVISSSPRWEVAGGTSVLAMLKKVTPITIPDLARLFRRFIPPLIEHLQASSKENFNMGQWKCKLVTFLDAIMEHAPYPEWNNELMEELATQLPSFSQHEREEGFLLRCLGRCLVSCEDSDLIISYLRTMFGSMRFNSMLNHADLVIGFQYCVRGHECECRTVLMEFELAMDRLEKDPDDVLDEITPAEQRANFGIPDFAAERSLQEKIRRTQRTLALCASMMSD